MRPLAQETVKRLVPADRVELEREPATDATA